MSRPKSSYNFFNKPGMIVNGKFTVIGPIIRQIHGVWVARALI